MVESSDEPTSLDRIGSSLRKANASYGSSRAGDRRTAQPLKNTLAGSDAFSPAGPPLSSIPSSRTSNTADLTSQHVAEKGTSILPPPAPSHENGDGEASSSIDSETGNRPNIIRRFYEACKEILYASWINVLLVFVPVGIAVQAAGVNKTIVFAINAIAIVPLAGLLSHATESVASDLGDTIGALMNITFGNAVELIILYDPSNKT